MEECLEVYTEPETALDGESEIRLVNRLSAQWQETPARELSTDANLDKIGGPTNTEGRMIIYDILSRFYEDYIEELGRYQIIKWS